MDVARFASALPSR
jgi:hypothetical protein